MQRNPEVDAFLIAHRRSQRVFEFPGMIDVCGGALEPIESPADPLVDPVATKTSDLEEELGIGVDAIAEIDCLGIARDGLSLKPKVLMHTRLAIASDDIRGLSGDEHSALFMVPGDPASVSSRIERHWEEFTPATLACLVSHTACSFANRFAASWAT
jgi:hypothetical protein